MKVQWLAHDSGHKGVLVSKALLPGLGDDINLDFDDSDINSKPKKGQQGRAHAAEGINVKMQYVVDRAGVMVDGHHTAVI
jgi:hypothetical protein